MATARHVDPTVSGRHDASLVGEIEDIALAATEAADLGNLAESERLGRHAFDLAEFAAHGGLWSKR